MHSDRHVVTIGEFDGVHMGHQALISRVRSQARERGVDSAIVTFDKHPASIVRPEAAPPLLATLDQKIELLHATGIDFSLVIHFDSDRANQSATHFVETVLVERLRACEVIVGDDFRFGRSRVGDVALLQALGEKHDFTVERFAPVIYESSVVSSTRIRRALELGEIELANRLLTRPHELEGIVVMGDGRGRELGFPTANVTLSEDVCIPADGVYAGVYVFPNGDVHAAAISVGTRPTFYEQGINLIEAYLLDYDGDLYGQRARVRFTHRIRDQLKFDNVDQLIVQMQNDVAGVRSVLRP